MDNCIFILQSTKGKSKKELIEERQALNERIIKNKDETFDNYVIPTLISKNGLEYMTDTFDSIIDALATGMEIVDIYYFTYGWRDDKKLVAIHDLLVAYGKKIITVETKDKFI